MLTIRPEIPENSNSIRYVNEQALGSKEEAELVEKIRNRTILTISLVAIQNHEIVGHVGFCPVVIESSSSDLEATTLAPMSVLSAYQRQSIGSQLVRAALKNVGGLATKLC